MSNSVPTNDGKAIMAKLLLINKRRDHSLCSLDSFQYLTVVVVVVRIPRTFLSITKNLNGVVAVNPPPLTIKFPTRSTLMM